MKQKCDKTIVIKFFVALFAVSFSFFANVFAQYYYFTSSGEYQQGCNEVLEVRVNSQGKSVRGGRFHLVLDPNTTDYPKTGDVLILRNFFSASTDTFIQWTSEQSPSWKGNDYTILQADRNNGTKDYNGSNKLYANVNFKPKFSGGLYDIVFGMEYISGDATTETTLSLAGGKELIDPAQQELYGTGSFIVLQEPCVADTKNPTVENVSIINNSTKVSYLSGLTFSLKDEGGLNGIGNVPYIWSGLEWTGNVGGLITNQYGIDADMVSVTLVGNGHSSKIVRINDEGVSTVWDKKTWQDTGLNLNVSISSGGLFDFGIEKQISIAIVVYDRAGNHNTKTITFNKPKGPELIQNSVSPKDADIYVNLSEPIKLGIKDDWAGVDSGTIKITVYGINGTTYGPYVFSGVDLNLSGVQGNANEPDYRINITNHEKFPTSGTIKVEVYAKDMEGTVDIIDDYIFSTRPDCTDFQCCDPVWLDLGNEGDTYYYNTGLIISGGNNPTFSVDPENNTGVIDCNAESDGLSVYSGQDNFVFFTDESVLTILGTGVKGVLSGNVLTLSYIIDDSQIIIDKPNNLELLSGGEVDIQWHLTGVENRDDWLSGYVVQISGEDFNTGLFVNETGIIEILPDGEYEIVIYPVDVLGNTGNAAIGSFIIDTTGPDFEFNDRFGYECETGYLEIVEVNDFSSLYSLPYSFDGFNWTGNNKVIINSQTTTGFVFKTGYVKDVLENRSEKSATYEFIDTGISVNISDLDLGTLTGNYVTGIVNLYEGFGASEGNCGIEKLGLEVLSCNNSTGNIGGGNIIIDPNVYFEGVGKCNLKITDDDGNESNVSISFEVDTKASSCALLIQNNQCTSGEVILLLTGDDVCGYNWDGSNNWMTRTEGITTGVYELGMYTGYVVDGNGNISGCSVEVTTDNLDKTGFTVLTVQATGYECQTITGYIQVSTGDTCGKKNLSDFTFNWNNLGYSNNLLYGTSFTGSGVQNVSVYVQDLVGNTENVAVSYIWYDSGIQFSDIEISSIGNDVVEFNWKNEANVRDGDCGSETIEFSGFVSTGSHGICEVNGDVVTYTPNIEVQYEGADSCIFEIRDDEGNIQTVTINLGGVDTKKPECSISYNENVCTNGDISLTMSATGANEYSWIGFNTMVADNLPHNVNGNGIYTGYVRDLAGNTGICVEQVETFDNIAPIITIPTVENLTAEECTLIQGVITVIDNDGCGDGFNYSWVGFGSRNNANYSGYSEIVGGQAATVSVRDSAGNMADGTVNYNWTDTGVQLNNGNIQTISTMVLTGGNSYNTTTGTLISLFGASEGNCGPKYISVEKVSCSGLSMDIDVEGNIVVTGNSNLSQIGSCTLRFSDNDGNSENGTLNIRVDTVAPGITLEGTNLACMSTNTFDVTGIFTESVQGFTLGDVLVQNGSKSNFGGEGSEYTWKIAMDPMVEVQVSVPAGIATDLNGTENTASNTLIGMYDNVGPIAVSLIQPGAKVYASSTTLSWNSTIDSGCAGVSGYNWEIYSGNCGNGVLKSAGFIASGYSLETAIDGLVGNGNYCRRVQPVDNFGNKGNWVESTFVVDLINIGCTILPIEGTVCTSGGIQVQLVADTDYTMDGEVYLSWTSTGDYTHTSVSPIWMNYSGQVVMGYISQPSTNKSNFCVYTATNIIDQIEPTILALTAEPVSECTTGIATIQAIDYGCASSVLEYKWNGGIFGDVTSFSQWSGKVGTKTVNIQVRDNVGNITGGSVIFEWTDSPISGNNFTGHTGVGRVARSVNWKTESHVSDGACGDGTVEFSGFVNNGTKGICTTGEGDMIIYTPNLGEIGDDSCTIQVKDDEGGVKNIVISWEGIDIIAPNCTINNDPNSCVSGSVLLTLTANETLSQVVGGGINWGLSENVATGNVNGNLEYNIEIRDLAGNIGNCTGKVDYINTGVLDKPVGFSPEDGTNTNNKVLNLSWSAVEGKGCRSVSGYEIQIISGGGVLTQFTNSNMWISPELDDGEYVIKVRAIDNLGGESEWTEITIIVDTVKPTCEIQYDNACISGNVQLTMVATGANFYSWISFDDMTNSLSPNSVSSNGTYYCYVKDKAGNTGKNSVELTNIKTGALSSPSNLMVVGGTPTNDSTPEFVWNEPDNDGCRLISKYEIQVLSGGIVVYSDEVTGTGWTSNILSDGEYVVRVRTKDSLSGYSQWTGLSFVVDNTVPICSIEILTQECTNSGVEIKLSGNMLDISEYAWWDGTTGSTIITVYENGIYTGYVYDLAGNQGSCTGMVGVDIQDQNPVSFEIYNVVGYECEQITGSVLGILGDSCGKDNLNKFIYTREGGVNNNEYGIISNSVTGFNVFVTIVDGAGNSTGVNVSYIRQDTGVTLLSGGNHDIGIITGNYDATIVELIDLFGATEGECGKVNITVIGGVCSGATMTINNGSVSITPDFNLDGSIGYCDFVFGDDEGIKTVVGRLDFVVDNVSPELNLTGNIMCVKGGKTFVVTGIWNENVEGFELGDISVLNGIKGSTRLYNENPIYSWSVMSYTEGVGTTTVTVSTNVVTDSAGNSNLQEEVLSWEYDNAGPDNVGFTNWQNTIFTTETTLNWDAANDSGCAGISGYNYRFVKGNNCNNNVVYNGFKSDTSLNVNNLSHGETYTLCIQAIDNFGNVGNWIQRSFDVDLNSIGCMITESACSSTGVILTLKPGIGVEGGNISLSWTGFTDMESTQQLIREETLLGIIVTGYIKQISAGVTRSSICTGVVTNIDTEKPVIDSVIVAEGYECQIITGSISMIDGGCGNDGDKFMYQWAGNSITGSALYSAIEYEATGYIVYVSGYDGVSNSVNTGVQFTWLNSPITWVDFTGNNNVGNTGRSVNWKNEANVRDGDCGSGTVEVLRFINSGSKGECLVNGDILTYIPYEGQTGNDMCILKVEDDEGDTALIKISWEGIDTQRPSCILAVGEGQSCTSGNITLSLSSESNDVVGYSFDGENRASWTSVVTMLMSATGTYTGYVKDSVGNVSEACTVEVTGGILDLDNPTLNVSNWTGYECSTGSITITGNDNSCGVNGLYYGWEGTTNITNINEIYSENPGSQIVQVFVYDGVGYSASEQVIYTWQDIPVTGHNFTVENVGTGITVDWFLSGNVSAGSCELQNILATTSNSKCTVNGHNITYIPNQGLEGWEDCVINVADGDGEGINIQIIFTGVDTKSPTVQLVGGVGEACTNNNIFVVTGIFSEQVQGSLITLTGENVEINGFVPIDGRTYEWTVEMVGGTGKVWINSGVLDLVGNESEGSNVLVLGNYDNIDPQSVSLLSPGPGNHFVNRTISFEWTSSNDDGCSGLSGYILNICHDSDCNDVVESVFTDDTGVTITLQNNGDYYWTVVPVDVNGNTGTGETGYFDVESSAPTCSITQSECSNSPVTLILTGNKTVSIVSGNVSWLKIGESSYTSEINENIDVWTIVGDVDGQTGYCHLPVTNYDIYGPNFNFVGINVNEGEPLNIVISAEDTGCAGISGYIFGTSFGLGSWQAGNRLRVTAEQIGRTGGIEREQVITVVDNLGNISVRTGKIKINDVEPTLSNSTGVLNGIHTGDFVVDIIDFFGAVEGNCGTGDLVVEVVDCVYATGRISGHNLIVAVDENADGLGSCSVKIKDNEGSYSDVDGMIEFAVKTKKPVCSGLIYEPEGWSSGSSVTVYLTGCSESILGTGYHIFTGNGEYTFEFEDLYGNTGSLFVQYTGFDREGPVFDFNSNSGYECQTGILVISNAIDSGIGLSDLPYSFDGINRSTGNTREFYFAGSTGISVLGYVRDGLGNKNEVQASYVFNNSIPTATGFTISVLRGVDVNWKDLSDASDGACGSGVLFASVTGGNIGHCLVSGDILSYTPNDISVTGVDNCELTIYDDEGSFVEINVELTDINEYPYIELVQPENGKIIDSGNITLSWTGVGNSELIVGYVYRIWSANDELVVEQTGSDVTIDFLDGSYNWNVYAKYIDGTTGSLTDTYSFNVVTQPIPSGSEGGGGGRYGLRKDKCPNGDLSDSYYDGTCEANGGVHGSAGSDFCGIMESSYSNEQKGAYLYSYTYGITTQCPIQSANLDGYLIRSHFAKMISEFAVNVLGNKPEKGKEGCDKFDDIGKLSDELRGFVITACELGLMGLEPDGVTPSKSFNPGNNVTRAQFGTVFSRLLFGDMYNVKDEDASTEKGSRYKGHLQALKRYGIMTKIDGDRPNYLERRGRVMIMLQRSDYYGIFAGKVPAKNGIEALFGE